MSQANASAVGAAVIGTGFIGSLHIETLRRLGVNLRGVLTRDGAAATNSGRFPKVYTTWANFAPTTPSTLST